MQASECHSFRSAYCTAKSADTIFPPAKALTKFWNTIFQFKNGFLKKRGLSRHFERHDLKGVGAAGIPSNDRKKYGNRTVILEKTRNHSRTGIVHSNESTWKAVVPIMRMEKTRSFTRRRGGNNNGKYVYSMPIPIVEAKTWSDTLLLLPIAYPLSTFPEKKLKLYPCNIYIDFSWTPSGGWLRDEKSRDSLFHNSGINATSAAGGNRPLNTRSKP